MGLEIVLGLLLIFSIQINCWQWKDNKRLNENIGNLRIENIKLKGRLGDR